LTSALALAHPAPFAATSHPVTGAYAALDDLVERLDLVRAKQSLLLEQVVDNELLGFTLGCADRIQLTGEGLRVELGLTQQLRKP
jgi:hypothetical protein